MPVSDLKWALSDLAERLPRYKKYRSYYDGEQRLTFSAKKIRNTFGHLFQEMYDNICVAPVTIPSDRLTVATFAVPGRVEADKRVDPAPVQEINDLWAANRMNKRAGEIHATAFKEGDAFLIVALDSQQRARMWPQKPSTMAVRYSEDEPDRIEVAAKVWVSRRLSDGVEIFRANLYYADHTERYATGKISTRELPSSIRGFRPYTEDEIGPEVPNPDGIVPVFHFANDAETGEYGRSILKHVLPLQDALNKTLADLLVTGEFHAFPQRWATGVEPKYDAEGNEVAPFKSGPERIWTVGAADGEFGQFQAADPTGFLAVCEAFRLEVARVTGLPPHMLLLQGQGTSDAASGESKKTDEGRLVKIAKDRQDDWGEEWERAAEYAARLEGVTYPEHTKCQWESAATRDELVEVQVVAAKKEIGVSTRQCLRELHYTEAEIDAMEAENEQAQADVAALVGNALSTGRALTPGQSAGMERESVA